MRAALVLPVLVALAAGPLLPRAAHAKLYKWVDDDGNVTYSERKPPDQKADEVKLHGVKPADAGTQDSLDSMQDEADTQQKDREFKTSYESETAEREARIKENCEIARQNMRILTTASRIQDKDSDGNPYFLDEQAKQARIEKTRQQVEEYCK